MDRRREVDLVEVAAIVLVDGEDLVGRCGRGEALVYRDVLGAARHLATKIAEDSVDNSAEDDDDSDDDASHETQLPSRRHKK
jgi:hypothetical protein